MATVVLQTVGAAIGGAVAGPIGAIIGRAAGAAAGYAIDQSLLSKDQVITGPRLEGTRLLTSSETAPISRVYGRNRLSGQIIWATRFEEEVRSEESGGKGGGPKQTSRTFSYFANFAVGICEGPVSCLRRVWADGEELDLTKVEYRFYRGTSAQLPDPLIEAKQGLGNAPAYRGTCYIVFERLPLETYGNRVPQLSFEIVRSIGKLEKDIRSITIIPGSTEYGYDPLTVESGGEQEVYNAHNRHVSIAESDWTASLDELQAVCPNLKTVALVVSWFGTDLRAENCQLLPGVTNPFAANWQVAGLRRHQAHMVSQVNGRPAFGGTPDDASVLRAIADLKTRGLQVVLYPFIMMDIPQENELPGLTGTGTQPTYPWRGEISCFPGIGAPGSVDKSAAARTQLGAFAAEYVSFIEHYIDLAKTSEGLSGFLIGSELRSLTRVRDQNGAFPFVETLTGLAALAKAELGEDCLVTYGADWSEYFGYQPQDGSGDVLYNLDALWASPNIDAVGIDNYMPLADWRQGGDPQSGTVSPYDLEYLKSSVASGEGYEWYYASQSDRQDGARTPITDGQNEPWIYRYKDLVSWWSLPHHERHAGVRQTSPTAWQPQSKPFFLTELGCPAVDKGANQPNVFYDPKSAQSALPYFSSGGRDDLVQRRFLEAHFEHWKDPQNNPTSTLYPGRMVDIDYITPWAWDARPFPWFPLSKDVWADGENWSFGHWLNGRLGGCSLQDLVEQVLIDYGYEDAEVTLDGILDGFIIPAQGSARQALEPIFTLYDVIVSEVNGRIQISQSAYSERSTIDGEYIVQEDDQAKLVSKRVSELEMPAEAVLTHATIFQDYEEIATKSRRLNSPSDRQISMQAPIVVSEMTANMLTEQRLRNDWFARDDRRLHLSTRDLAVSTGDVVALDGDSSSQWLVEQTELGIGQEVSLRRIPYQSIDAAPLTERPQLPPAAVQFGRPYFVLMDLPALRSSTIDQSRYLLAAAATPWAGDYNLFSSAETSGFAYRDSISTRAIMGELRGELRGGASGRIDYQNEMIVKSQGGQFESRQQLQVLNGSNVLAVEANNGSFEILQFENAILLSNGSWKLSGLLRGQLGTEGEAKVGSHAGNRVVLLNEALVPIELQDSEQMMPLNWRLGPARDALSESNYKQVAQVYGGRAQQMFSPVHLHAQALENGDLKLSWIRRSRINSDSWDNPEVPLDASVEAYRLEVRTLAGELIREEKLPSSVFLYSLADRLSDLGDAHSPFEFSVAQLNDTLKPGGFASMQVSNQ